MAISIGRAAWYETLRYSVHGKSASACFVNPGRPPALASLALSQCLQCTRWRACFFSHLPWVIRPFNFTVVQLNAALVYRALQQQCSRHELHGAACSQCGAVLLLKLCFRKEVALLALLEDARDQAPFSLTSHHSTAQHARAINLFRPMLCCVQPARPHDALVKAGAMLVLLNAVLLDVDQEVLYKPIHAHLDGLEDAGVMNV
eukprot:1161244-Pelagomonas_calceolata.AAC.9